MCLKIGKVKKIIISTTYIGNNSLTHLYQGFDHSFSVLLHIVKPFELDTQLTSERSSELNGEDLWGQAGVKGLFRRPFL